ncbi:hypothetical protein BOFE_05310 [Candidatus Borrelia fainii]|uniref:Uncharacterized protein n=1 Tax=Candidatus Borrelia fainii TaxID=2518322 RepID=A0ABM8DKF1_9SPIR|nr:hypothetical protein BOFE_05310 [Candidatus Borrelia fainii]
MQLKQLKVLKFFSYKNFFIELFNLFGKNLLYHKVSLNIKIIIEAYECRILLDIKLDVYLCLHF